MSATRSFPSVEPPQRERIRDDLRGLIRGEILWDDLSRVLYSTDASIFEVRPAGVVVPRDEEDVQALVRYAAEHQVPLVPRGAGTGVAGESLGAALVVAHRRRTRFDRCGYLLHDVLDGDHLDLARLLVGSEGTLALFTEATLRTIPLPGGRALALFGFDSLDDALHVSRLALPAGPSACEL